MEPHSEECRFSVKYHPYGIVLTEYEDILVP
jgi:hypothetical protein